MLETAEPEIPNTHAPNYLIFNFCIIKDSGEKERDFFLNAISHCTRKHF